MSIERHDCSQRMSRAVIHNQVAYLCGQVPADENQGIAGQTASTLQKIEDLLAEVGSDKSKLLSVTIYVRDMKDFAGMNEVWDAWVAEGTAPARACVEARMARPSLLVEMSCTAAI